MKTTSSYVKLALMVNTYNMRSYIPYYNYLHFIYICIGEPNIVLCCVSKQILIYELSPVLILHIKRFSIGSYRVTKDDRRLSFYFVLDMAPFCTTECIEVYMHTNTQI